MRDDGRRIDGFQGEWSVSLTGRSLRYFEGAHLKQIPIGCSGGVGMFSRVVPRVVASYSTNLLYIVDIHIAQERQSVASNGAILTLIQTGNPKLGMAGPDLSDGAVK